MFKIMVNIIVC